MYLIYLSNIQFCYLLQKLFQKFASLQKLKLPLKEKFFKKILGTYNFFYKISSQMVLAVDLANRYIYLYKLLNIHFFTYKYYMYIFYMKYIITLITIIFSF